MGKYKNKDGIELNIGGMSEVGRIGSGADLTQEVIREAIKILTTYNRNSKVSMYLNLYCAIFDHEQSLWS